MNTPSLTQQHRGWTLLVTSLSVFMLLLDINVVNVALPEIRKELDASLRSSNGYLMPMRSDWQQFSSPQDH